jgi:hypothetical protein
VTVVNELPIFIPNNCLIGKPIRTLISWPPMDAFIEWRFHSLPATQNGRSRKAFPVRGLQPLRAEGAIAATMYFFPYRFLFGSSILYPFY